MLGALPPIVDPNVLVATVDFFTPIVDDPSEFGAIAAANALSDVYAMGARPLFALGITAFPRAKLSTGLLEKIVSGGASKMTEAGIAVVTSPVPRGLVRNRTSPPRAPSCPTRRSGCASPITV